MVNPNNGVVGGGEEEGQIGDINSCDKKINQSHPSLSLFANAEARKYRRFPPSSGNFTTDDRGSGRFCREKNAFFFLIVHISPQNMLSIQWARPNDKLRL